MADCGRTNIQMWNYSCMLLYTYIMENKHAKFQSSSTNTFKVILALNYYKTKELRICFKKSALDIALLTIDGRPIQQVNSTRLLGVALSEVAITHR